MKVNVVELFNNFIMFPINKNKLICICNFILNYMFLYILNSGLSFSVNQGTTIPPSLYNIFKEIKLEYPERDYKFNHGDLSKWVDEEKIFLLNSALTVECASPGCHLALWEWFTDQVIKYISEINESCIFLLFGSYAKAKTKFIDEYDDRCVLRSHPSPLSANRGGFFNTGIFKEVEEKAGLIDWSN